MEQVRTDDCADVMRHFAIRLLKDAVGDCKDPFEVHLARKYITEGVIEDRQNDMVSPFTFEQMVEFLGWNYDVIIIPFIDLELIGWQKKSPIYNFILKTLENHKGKYHE